MHFYIDESGHTGTNLFDEAQPTLYYGLLHSEVDVDVHAQPKVQQLRKQLGVDRLHANELGNSRLGVIANDLISLQRRFRLRFDLYRVKKVDHAVICFFDQVFDQGLNPAVPWVGYWSALRYMLLLKVASLFDMDLARKAWNARINTDDDSADATLIEVCKTLVDRVDQLPDARSQTVIRDSLNWAIHNPREISYNAADAAQVLQVAPNIVGFQLVMNGIAGRLRAQSFVAPRIIVDRQSQFNKAQRTLAEFYASAAGLRLEMGPGMPEVNFEGMPTVPIEFRSSTDSTGLEIVDIYIWLFKRILEGKEIAKSLQPLIKYQMRVGRTDEVSFRGIAKRMEEWDARTPSLSEMPAEQLARGRELQKQMEARRLEAVQKLPKER